MSQNTITKILKSETTLIVVLVLVFAGIQGYSLLRDAQAGQGPTDGAKASVSDVFTNKNKAFLQKNKQQDDVITLESGLQYKIKRDNPFGKRAYRDSVVTVDYTATFIDGREFDSSYDRGFPARFPLTQVVPGWSEGVQLMREGERFILYIPAHLAYGSIGNEMVPPGSTLIYDVELIDVQ